VSADDAAQRADAARRGAGLFRLRDRALLAVCGADRVRWLDGMLSNDVARLEPGTSRSGCYALLLTPQGRILADFHVLQRGDELWLETAARGLAEIRARLERYIVADDVALEDRSGRIARVAVEGAAAPALLARALGAAPALAPDCGADFECAGRRVCVAAYGWSGASAYQLIAPADAEDALLAALRACASPDLPLVEGDDEVLEILRIEAGVPRLFHELDANVLPPEAGLVPRAVSLTKGCYTGQEIVARLVSRGAESHRLVALRFDGDPPPAGAELRADGRAVGSVTSTCRSARAGSIGLGFVRRPLDAEGALLVADGVQARVARPPLVAPTGAALTRGVLIVFAKRPEPGRVKTRLCPAFTPEQAAGLYRAMLADVLEASAGMAAGAGLDAVLAVAPAEACAELARTSPPVFRVIAQRGADLGARMEWAVAEAAAGGASPILLRGSDNPALGAPALAEALDALATRDLVLVPDDGGGFGLVGLRRPAPGLFAHPMSTSTVLEDTLEAAARLGLDAQVLSPCFDVDTVQDLPRLAALRGRPDAARCARTLAYLDAQRLWAVR
jgi:rSAM/selenodomain-associated transferase 1